MAKKTVTQRSWILGELHEDFLEADDLEARGSSCRKAKNVRVKSSRTLSARPGLYFAKNLGLARDIIELRPEPGKVFGLILSDTSLDVINGAGTLVYNVAIAPWTSALNIWVETFRDQTIIGGDFGIYTLSLADAVWTFVPFVFAAASGGEVAQPYWSFRQDITMRPSAKTGNITITSSLPFWLSGHIGQRMRYGKREILITSITSTTVANGTVITSLPPSFRLTMASVTSYRVGDAVVAQGTNFNGLIVAIAGSTIDVVTLAFFDGPDLNEVVSGPNGSAKVTSKVEIALLASPIWDEALISPTRGYPRSGASAAGRLTLVDFPLVPDLICMSSVREIADFQVGAKDDDAIVRTAGDNSPRFLHAINAGDLILLSDRGLYYVSIRDGGLLTPASFNAILFDQRAANSVRPVRINAGVVFVEASGQAISAAVLDGNYYLKWSVKSISIYHSQLIKSPVKLCGPSLFAETPEKYLMVVNSDGTLAVMSWLDEFSPETIGFVPWDTDGNFLSVSPIFGAYWAIVDRKVNDNTFRTLERFSDNAVVDGAVYLGDDPLIGIDDPLNGTIVLQVLQAPHLIGANLHLFLDGRYAGIKPVGANGQIVNPDFLGPNTQCGFNFVALIQPWPVEIVESPRGGLYTARLIQGAVSVINTGVFTVRCNKTTKSFGGMAFGDDLVGIPQIPPRKYLFTAVGRLDHPEIEITKPLPGYFHVLAVTQEVTY